MVKRGSKMLRTLISVCVFALSPQANAALVQITMEGSITSEGPGLFGGTTPSLLSPGDTVKAFLSYDDTKFATQGIMTYFDMFRYGDLRVEAGPYRWGADFLDGLPAFDCAAGATDCDGIALPAAVWKGAHFQGFFTTMDIIDAPYDIDFTSRGGNSFSIGEFGYLAYFGASYEGKFDPSKTKITISGGPSAPGVPEPTTWTMALAGFGVMGSMFRNKRKSSMKTVLS